jgi:pimeloyl-ACP methyl ester carboxylesterase
MLAALLVALLATAAPAGAASSCLTVPSDAADIAAVRVAIEAACPCASFDATTPAKKHNPYIACARAVITDASDGTPIGGTVSLRTQCRSTVSRIVRDSDCGYLAAENRNPCCEHLVTSGKNRGAIRKAPTCTTNGVHIRHDCFAYHFLADACSNDATNSCLPTCGDGTKNLAEQCDGADAAQCPGLCQSDCTCPGIVLSQVIVPSAAQPAETPGSPGVVVTNPQLITQFGGSGFSLNNALAIRWAYDAPGAPDAILILVPGFEAGANSMKILAENLLPRALVDHALRLEVWGMDRRTNQLEDLAGLQIAESLADAHVALDWLFGGELTLTLDPALVAGPNRRAFFYGANADVPFMANWTNLMFSRDIDALVAAADAAVQNHNVFLGGHSAGTGFTARYASTDFNLTGVGPVDPGYRKVRGLVLLEGGGGSTSGAPLSADSLDRMIAKADGGNFGATRDNAARCKDGTTACTIDTEAVDCVGQTPPKCTPAAAAYSVVPGLLTPRILSAGELTAIQVITDPNTGEALLTVDQGAPGNNAVAKVPDLATLAALPKGTAEAGLGSFLDDDGLVASIAPFVATSLGAPGPTVGGLLTWLAIEDGPMPPSVLPNNGPPPTSLPGGHWGQEKEVTRMDRMVTTFYQGPSNFTDWYYPAAGPATTSAPGRCVAGHCTAGNVGAICTADAGCAQSFNLDSSQLSIGRGRRDIENLTQAASINVPVICFGGSNGLAPIPGAYTPFGSSIGVCTAPSCNGTPRILNPVAPNPAFPTFGGVGGGFEVYISEGFAHVDIITAEDGPDNNVIGHLSDFLERNAQ